MIGLFRINTDKVINWKCNFEKNFKLKLFDNVGNIKLFKPTICLPHIALILTHINLSKLFVNIFFGRVTLLHVIATYAYTLHI